MKTKLISMIDYILHIDWMTTVEFCDKTGASLPTIKGGSDSFLQIDAIKHRMFVEYAKFLNKDLCEDMFVGNNPIFPDFVKCTPAVAEAENIELSFDNFGKNEFMMRIFQKGYKAGGKTYDTWVTYFHLKKVSDLVNFGLFYNKKE